MPKKAVTTATMAEPSSAAPMKPTLPLDTELLSSLIAPYDPETANPPMGDDVESEISRTMSHRVTDGALLYAELNKLLTPLPVMGNGRPYPPALPKDRRAYEVQFDGKDDPIHPFNWLIRRKLLICLALALSAMSVSMGSAMFSAGTAQVAEQYHVGWSVATLGTTLFVFGFASGPVIWGPLSELYGRRIVLLCSAFGYMCFTFATAVCKDLQLIMLCRFFSGFIGAAPLVVAPAAFTDMFSARYRGTAVTIFVLTIFAGPMLAPILGGFTVKNSSLGWRWTCYFTGIIGSLAFVLCVFFFPETYAPMILIDKAENLRRRTGNWGIYAPHEEFKLSLKEICEKNITRPLVMLFTEPILFLITLYNAFVYGILYMFLTAVPLIFGGLYGWSGGVAELPYIAMLIGVFCGSGTCILFERKYAQVIDRDGWIKPEDKLLPMMIGGVIFTIGIFWMGWSGGFGPRVHWIVPTIGAVPIGAGLIMIFLPCFNYIIDCYLIYAASAIAGNTFLRSAFGAVFPLFTRQMFVNLEVKWASTLVGCLAAILIPVPLYFYYRGEKKRVKSKYSIDIRDLLKQMGQAPDEAQAEDEEKAAEGQDVKSEVRTAEGNSAAAAPRA